MGIPCRRRILRVSGAAAAIAPAFTNSLSLPGNGIDVYGSYGNNLHTDRTDARTWGWWMKVTDYANFNTVISEVDIGVSPLKGVGIYVRQTAGKLIFSMFGSDTASLVVATDAAVGTGTWDHWAVVKTTGFNGSAITIYKNGSAVPTTTESETITTESTTSSANNSIGRNPAGVSYFKGNIDEFPMFNAALNSTQVAQLYNGGVPVDVSTLSFVANALVWPRFGDTTGDTNSLVKNALNPGTLDLSIFNLVALSTDHP